MRDFVAMDRIEDSEIAPLWAEHFPRRHQTAVSLTLIFALMLIIARKAGHSSAIDDVLAVFEIPVGEFDRMITEYEAFERSVKGVTVLLFSKNDRHIPCMRNAGDEQDSTLPVSTETDEIVSP